MIAATHIERAKAALQDIAETEAKAQAERSKLLDLQLQRMRNDNDRERLRAEEERDAAIRLLDGEAAAPRKPRRSNRLTKYDAEAPALTAAIKQQEQRTVDADAIAKEPKLPLVDVTLDIVSEIQVGGIAEVRAKLAEVAPAVAQLIAADQVRLALIGEKFPLPRGKVPPFKGLSLAKALSEAIPERIRPPQLAEDQLLDAAREISGAILEQIKGNQS